MPALIRMVNNTKSPSRQYDEVKRIEHEANASWAGKSIKNLELRIHAESTFNILRYRAEEFREFTAARDKRPVVHSAAIAILVVVALCAVGIVLNFGAVVSPEQQREWL